MCFTFHPQKNVLGFGMTVWFFLLKKILTIMCFLVSLLGTPLYEGFGGGGTVVWSVNQLPPNLAIKMWSVCKDVAQNV